MKSTILFVLSALCLWTINAAGETEMVPLPSFSDDYFIGSVCNGDTITLHSQVDSIAALTIHLEGTAEIGLSNCYAAGYQPQSFEFFTWIRNPDGLMHFYSSEMIFESGPFEITREYRPESFNDWELEYFMSGTGVFYVCGNVAPDYCAYVQPYSHATITDAYLIVEGDLFLASDTTSWCAVKSLYR